MNATAPNAAAPSSARLAPSTRTEPARRTMSAIVHHQYGEPDVLTLGEVNLPVPGDDDVLIRVVAAGVSIGDHHIVTGKPYLVRLSPFGGFPRPKHKVPGAAMSGRIAAVGARVTGLQVGDEVFGHPTARS